MSVFSEPWIIGQRAWVVVDEVVVVCPAQIVACAKQLDDGVAFSNHKGCSYELFGVEEFGVGGLHGSGGIHFCESGFH